METENKYLKNILELSVTAKCDLNRFYNCFEHFDDILLNCGFPKKFVEQHREKFEGNLPSNKVVLAFDTPLIKEPKDVEILVSKFSNIFAAPKYVEAGFFKHENELVMLCLFLHKCYWLDNYDLPKDYYKTNKTAKEVKFSELSIGNKNLVQLQETAAIIKLLVVYNERLSKGFELEDTQHMYLDFLNSHAKITSNVTLDIIMNSMEQALLNAKIAQIGDGIGLIMEYSKAKEIKDYSVLKKFLDMVEKLEPYKSQNPPINRAIAIISFHIQAYLIEHQLITQKARPALLLSFLEDIFEILEIRFILEQTKTAESKKALSVILKDQIKSMRS